jgi:hypothetical protein
MRAFDPSILSPPATYVRVGSCIYRCMDRSSQMRWGPAFASACTSCIRTHIREQEDDGQVATINGLRHYVHVALYSSTLFYYPCQLSPIDGRCDRLVTLMSSKDSNSLVLLIINLWRFFFCENKFVHI